jgi:hypothetical protein
MLVGSDPPHDPFDIERRNAIAARDETVRSLPVDFEGPKQRIAVAELCAGGAR